MTMEGLIREVKVQGNTAVGALINVAAIPAEGERGEPPAVQKEKGLLPALGAAATLKPIAGVQTLNDPNDGRAVLGVIKSVRLSPEDVQTFAAKLLALADEFAGRAAGNGEVYSLNASLYPTLAGSVPGREIVIRSGEKPAG